MMNVRSLALAVVVAAGMGCNGNNNPLVGDWTTASTTLGVTTTTTYKVNGDGTLEVDESGSGTCTGSSVTTGLSWASTSSSITFSGTPTCNGSVTCDAVTINCSGAQTFKAGSCTYTLSNNDDTLSLTSCSGISDQTLIRGN